MDDEDEFGKSPLGLSSKQERKHSNNKGQEEKRKLKFSDHGNIVQGESLVGEEELYGDLYDSTGNETEGIGILRLKVSRLVSDIGVKDSMISSLEKTVRELQEEIDRLKEANKVLEYNISSLFTTAKMEIDRKDAEIKSLRERKR